jgi:hypothetical protein
MEGIFESIITPGMAALAAASIAIMLFVGKIPIKGKRLNTTKFWTNWGEFILVALCIAGSFAPGVTEIPKSEWGSILIFAAVSALVAHLGRKILKPIFIAKIEGKIEGE